MSVARTHDFTKGPSWSARVAVIWLLTDLQAPSLECIECGRRHTTRLTGWATHFTRSVTEAAIVDRQDKTHKL